MSGDRNEKDPLQEEQSQSRVSRRDFLKISGISAAVPLVAGSEVVIADDKKVPVYGPGKLAMEFTINRKKYKADLEPRVTLLDALRDHFQLTGAKRVCDRGECGACTVLMDDRASYSCMVLAIEAQGSPDHHGRIAGVRQRIASGTTSLCRLRCFAMRILHPRFCNG
jgi:Aerobic-type carbon monoxide dehydrogenase, small subunit CoxS/CutS homologs